jgi:hypothetical protein
MKTKAQKSIYALNRLSKPTLPGGGSTQRFDHVGTCTDCNEPVTRNRKIIMGKATLCVPCHAARFGLGD